MPDVRPSVGSTTASAARLERAEVVKARWQAGEEPDARAALDADPELARDKKVVLDLALDEYCLREDAGAPPPDDEFADAFPTYRASVLRLLSVYRFMKGLPAAEPITWPRPGDDLDGYVVDRELGRGGFARAYLAKETKAGDRAVVLKVSASGRNEAATLGRLAHPHVMSVLTARQIGDRFVVVMPFLGHATLEDVLSSARPTTPRRAGVLLPAPLPAAQPVVGAPAYPIRATDSFTAGVLTVGTGIADALAFLHARSLAHQDLKPSNVLLASSGHPYLLDFNLSGEAGRSAEVGGTVPYMAPEQLRAFGSREATATYDRAAADVYSLGVILYELLTGRHPFPTGLPKAGPAAAVRDALAARVRGFVPLRGVAAFVNRCLAESPADRPTARSVARRLRWAARLLRNARRAGAVAGVAAVVAVGLAAAWPAPQAPESPAATAPKDKFQAGLELLNEGHHELAASAFAAAALDRKDARAYSYVSFCYAYAGAAEPAIAAATQAIELGGDSAVVRSNRAFCYLRTNRLDQAHADCTAAIQLDERCRPAYYQRARVALQRFLGARVPVPPEALRDIDFVLESGPVGTDGYLLAARLHAAAPNFDREKVLKLVRAAVANGATKVGEDPVLVAVLDQTGDFLTAFAACGGTSPLATPDLVLAPDFLIALQTPRLPSPGSATTPKLVRPD